MKLIKKDRCAKKEKKYFVQEISQAIGMSEGTVQGFFRNAKSTKDGLTLAEIVQIIERPRTRGDGIDFNEVNEIRNRLKLEYGYEVDWSDERDMNEQLMMEAE